MKSDVFSSRTPLNQLMILTEMIHDVRIIRLNAAHDPPDIRKWLGDSVGRWEDNVLVVTTTRIGWPYFKVRGVVAAPQSEAVEIVERFAFDPALGELSYSFTATDPATFTEPVTADRYHVWRYRPGIEVQRYDCTLEP